MGVKITPGGQFASGVKITPYTEVYSQATPIWGEIFFTTFRGEIT